MFDQENTKPALTVHDYWQILLRRRWWLIGALFVCWLLAWGASRLLPSVYRSETLILVEQQKVPEQYVVTNVSVDLQEQLQSMTQQILSRTRLERIIEKFHLYTRQRQRLGPDGLVDQMRKDIQIQLVEAPGKRGRTYGFSHHLFRSLASLGAAGSDATDFPVHRRKHPGAVSTRGKHH